MISLRVFVHLLLDVFVRVPKPVLDYRRGGVHRHWGHGTHSLNFTLSPRVVMVEHICSVLLSQHIGETKGVESLCFSS